VNLVIGPQQPTTFLVCWLEMVMKWEERGLNFWSQAQCILGELHLVFHFPRPQCVPCLDEDNIYPQVVAWGIKINKIQVKIINGIL
jgi:hypothetical protein